MIRITLVLGLLAIPAWGQMSRVSAAGCHNTAGTSCTLGTHQLGDVAFLYGTRVSNTAPSNPAGCTSIYGAGANTWSTRVCWYILSGAETTTKALTNANQMVAQVYRGADLANTVVAVFGGTAAYSQASSTTMSYCGTNAGTGCGTLTFTRANNTSWLIGIGTCASCTAGNVAPTGMTNDALSTTTLSVNDTEGTVSAWTTQNVTVTTTGAVRGIVIELLAAQTLTSCSSNCPTFITGRPWGTNDSVVASDTYTSSMNEAAIGGAGDLQVCGFIVGGTVAGAPTITGTYGGDSFTINKVIDDGVTVAGTAYITGPTAADQVLQFVLGTAEQFMDYQCYEFEHTDGLDAGPVGHNDTGGALYAVVSSGSLTTTQANDLIVMFTFSADGATGYPFSSLFQPAGSWNLLPAPFHQLGMAAAFTTWGGTGAINPAMFISTPTAGGSPGNYQTVALAFKNNATGSTPTGGRIVCVGMLSNTAPGAYLQQDPCPVTFATPNALTHMSNAIPSDMSITSVTDSNGNSYSLLNTAAIPQGGYAKNATFTNSNSHYRIFNNTGTNSPIVFKAYTGMDTATLYDATASTTASGSQVAKAASNTTCANNANSNSQATYTPTVANEIMNVAEYTGSGPEACVFGTNNVFDTMWYHTESDSDSFNTAGSGYGHLRNSSTALQTFTFGWANSAAAGPSNWAMRLMVLLPAPASAGHACSITLLGVGQC